MKQNRRELLKAYHHEDTKDTKFFFIFVLFVSRQLLPALL